MILDQLNADLKAAMLSRDTARTDTLKGVKSAIQYAEVDARGKGQTLTEDAIITILQKEAKKRSDSAELYSQNGAQDRADKELAEKALIETYLPAQLDEAALGKLVDEAIAAAGGVTQQTMGQVIGAVKARAGGAADGATIARLVKERVV